jgi:predicted acyltransferase
VVRPSSLFTLADVVSKERLLALDVFRGMTVAGMLLVNNPGSWGAIYPPLAHAPWHGWTPTDLIFPFFLFIVGITTHLSLSTRRARGDDDATLMRQVLRRGALIFLCGLTLNWFPGWSWATTGELADATWPERVVHRLEHLRILGVLQRIGLAYLLGGLLTVRFAVRGQLVAIALLLLGYWALMTLVPVPGTGQLGYALLDEPSQVLSAWIDRAVLGEAHLYSGAKTWDPEGLLSTLPAVGNVLLGALAGRWIAAREKPLTERLSALFAVGALGMMMGLCWHWVFPINKQLWTSSYVVFTSGLAAVTLATCLWLIDVQQWRGWTRFFVVYGTNPLLAFMGSGVMARLTVSLITWVENGKQISLQAAFHKAVFLSWLSPRPASLAYAVSFVLFWYVILAILHRRGIVVKV